MGPRRLRHAVNAERTCPYSRANVGGVAMRSTVYVMRLLVGTKVHDAGRGHGVGLSLEILITAGNGPVNEYIKPGVARERRLFT